MENLRRTRKPQQLAPAPRRPLRAHSRRRNRCQSPRLECCIDRVAPPSAALLHLSRGGSSRPGRSQTVGPPECDSGRRRGRRGDSASASKSGSIRAEHRDAGSCCGRVGAARVPAAMRRPLPLGKRQPGDRGAGRPSVPSVPTQDVIVLARNRRPANWRHCRDRRAAAVTNAATGQVLFAKGIASSDDLGAIATATRRSRRSARGARSDSPKSDHPEPDSARSRRGRFGARVERIHHPARLWGTAGWSARPARARTPVTSSARWRRSHSQLQYVTITADLPRPGVSVSAASTVAAFSGAVRLAGLRSRVCRCSHGHRPSGCDTEARDRRATLPQRHRREIGGSLTPTPLRRAYRLQRPCSVPIVGAYVGSA